MVRDVNGKIKVTGLDDSNQYTQITLSKEDLLELEQMFNNKQSNEKQNKIFIRNK